MIVLPHDAIVSVLRGSGITAVDWGPLANPSYRQATTPVPVDPFPLIVYDVLKNNGPAHTFNGAIQYNEEFTVVIKIYGTQLHIRALGTPYHYSTPQTSLIAYLDGLSGTPYAFNGDTFSCGGWYRKSLELHQDNAYSPDGANVFCMEADYYMLVNAQYP